jgi:septal ring factor EnvC (AmiA/AmiB activator)
MDKQIKQSILILGVLITLSVAFAIVFYLQKQAAENRAALLSDQVTEYETKDRETQKKMKGFQEESVKLRQELDKSNTDRAAAVKKSEQAQGDLDKLKKDLDKVQKERGEWDTKLANFRRERDDLLKQVTDLKGRPVPEKIVEKIVYRDRPVTADAGAAGAPADAQASQGMNTAGGVAPAQAMNDVFAAAAGSSMPKSVSRENEDYWAGVIKQKAALEIELQRVKEDLNESKLQVAEFKKSNSDFEMEIGRLKNEKEAIVRKIKYGEDLADNISVELARARNEQKLSQDRSDELLSENQQLRMDIRQLTTTKVALEKSIANLSEEKNSIEKKLVETENIIQGRIDEIWQIKKDIDSRIDAPQRPAPSEIELAPIVVSAKKNVPAAAPAAKQAAVKPAVPAPKPAAFKKAQGSVVSVNEDNNFVIVDLGERSGTKVGEAFKIYHNGVQIGAVEVIQVRQDISAADIKQKTAPFSVGDTVR